MKTRNNLIKKQVRYLLFDFGRGLSVRQLARVYEIPERQVEDVIREALKLKEKLNVRK